MTWDYREYSETKMEYVAHKITLDSIARFSASKPAIRTVAFTQERNYDHMQDTRFHLNITN